MHPHDRIHDAARAQALVLRAQAQRDFWAALGRVLRRAWSALRQRGITKVDLWRSTRSAASPEASRRTPKCSA